MRATADTRHAGWAAKAPVGAAVRRLQSQAARVPRWIQLWGNEPATLLSLVPLVSSAKWLKQWTDSWRSIKWVNIWKAISPVSAHNGAQWMLGLKVRLADVRWPLVLPAGMHTLWNPSQRGSTHYFLQTRECVGRGGGGHHPMTLTRHCDCFLPSEPGLAGFDKICCPVEGPCGMEQSTKNEGPWSTSPEGLISTTNQESSEAYPAPGAWLQPGRPPSRRQSSQSPDPLNLRWLTC